MTIEQMKESAQKENFTSVHLLPSSQLVFNAAFRLCCEENSCGNYNRNYGCPPDCGTPEEMQTRAASYANVLIMETKMEVDDINDNDIIKEIKKEHLRKSQGVVNTFHKAGIKGTAAMPGICSVCKECKKIANEPCAFPDRRTSCLSAYCIDVSKLAEACNSQVDWSGNSISYLSLFFF